MGQGLKKCVTPAALLTALAGKPIEKSNIKNILDSVGIECDEDKVKIVVDQLKGKDINELISEGSKKLASMPAGGSGGAAPVAPTSGGPAPAQEKKEEKKEEPEEESDDDMGFGLFD